jgi:hypothetical protein
MEQIDENEDQSKPASEGSNIDALIDSAFADSAFTQQLQRAQELGGRLSVGISYAGEPDYRVYIAPVHSEAMQAFIDRPA